MEEGVFAVRCHGVTKTYGAGATETSALRGIDLEVRFGELLMLVGPSGSGKTTLLSIMAGIMDQDEGECIVLDRNFRQISATERARVRGLSIGFVFQTFNLLPSLSAADNVSVPLLINGTSRKEAVRQAGALLETVGLSGRGTAMPTQLSGGQQQRVAIARALVHHPKLLVCDEPTSNLDFAAGREVMALLRREGRAADRAVVVVTHDQRMLEFADRVARLEDGVIAEVTEKGEGRAQ